jgi:hypothetical protein
VHRASGLARRLRRGASDTALPSAPATGTATLTVTSPSPPPAPAVNMAIAPATVTTGQSATLSWSSTHASECTASGAWSGLQDSRGSVQVSQSTPGNYVYTLGCSNAAGFASQTVHPDSHGSSIRRCTGSGPVQSACV